MTYEESNALMNDGTFRGRVKVAALKFADYVLIEPSNTPAHNTRRKWANAAITNPDNAAAELTPSVVMDPAVQNGGAGMSDAALQGAVEATINKLI